MLVLLAVLSLFSGCSEETTEEPDKPVAQDSAEAPEREPDSTGEERSAGGGPREERSAGGGPRDVLSVTVAVPAIASSMPRMANRG